MLKRDSSHVWSSTDDSHHPTAFNLRRVWQRQRQKSLWPTWKQHQINHRTQWKGKKKKGFQMKRPPRWFLWRRGAPWSTSSAAFATFIYVSRGPFFSRSSVQRYIVKFPAYMSGRADVDVCIQSCVGASLSVFLDIMRSVPFPPSCWFPCGGAVDVHLNQKSCWASASLI